MSLIRDSSASAVIKLNYVFFFNCALALFISYKVLQLSLLAVYVIEGPFALFIRIAICLSLLISEMLRCDVRQNLIVAAGALALGFAVTLSGATLSIFFTIAIIYEARNVPFYISAKVAVIATAISVSFVVSLSYLGILNDYIWEDSIRTRHGLGFRYCTYISLFYLNCVLLVTYIKQRMTFSLAFVLMAINYAIYLATVSRTGFALASIALLCALVWSNTQITDQHQKMICKVGKLAIPTAMTLSVLAIMLYDLSPETFSALNQMLSGRLAFTSRSLANYGITPFGQSIKFAAGSLDPSGILQRLNDGYDTNVVDNSFWSVLINHGLVLFVVVIGLYLSLGKKVVKHSDFRLATILIIISMHAVIDQGLIALWYNTFLLLFANYEYSIEGASDVWHAHAVNKGWIPPYRVLVNAWGSK